MFELVSWLSSLARFVEITDVFESFVSFQHIALSVCSFKLTRLPLFICRYSSTAIHPPLFIDHHSSFLSLPFNSLLFLFISPLLHFISQTKPVK